MLALRENTAASLGRTKFNWWLDWSGRAVAIVACGPSAKNANVGQLRGRMPVLAIKETAVDLCPWADAVYGCDAPWWKHKQGLKEFKGLKIAYSPVVSMEYPEVIRIEIEKTADKILVEKPGVIGTGGNSGFQALNIAVQFGATRILLIGFDMHGKSGLHYYGRNNWPGANNPDERLYLRWQKAFTINADMLEMMGVEVINASPDSALQCFEKLSIEKAIERWGL